MTYEIKKAQPTSSELIARPKYGGIWADTGRHWTDEATIALRVLCEAGADVEKSADAIGRSPTSIAYKARDSRLDLPDGWSKLIRPRPLRTRVERVVLQYPYVLKVRDEYADLLAVNLIVPRYIHGRDDMCQEILLALHEQRLTLAELRASKTTLRSFSREFFKKNYEARGHALSLDMPMPNSDRSWHEVLADPASLEDKTFDSFEDLLDQ